LEELFAKNGIKLLILFYFQHKKAKFNAKNNSEKFYHSFIFFLTTLLKSHTYAKKIDDILLQTISSVLESPRHGPQGES
jgi:hypothetical protein